MINSNLISVQHNYCRRQDHITRLILAACLLAVAILSMPARGVEAEISAVGWSTFDVARDFQTATLLPNGKVLLAGGRDRNGAALTSALLFDLVKGAWTAAAPLKTARYNHTATLLANGKVLVTGGRGAGAAVLVSAEIYDPGLNTWSTTGVMAVARAGQTATLLPDGKLLVMGGLNEANAATNRVERYDPATNAWSELGALNVPRGEHTATLVNGRVLVIGGQNGQQPVNSLESYDFATGASVSFSSPNAARWLHTATLLLDGNVLVAGGRNSSGSSASLDTAVFWNVASQTWTSAANLKHARAGHTATLLTNGRLLVFGGSNGTTFLSSAEMYEPNDGAGSWNPPNWTISIERSLHTATLLPGGNVLVAGGRNTQGVLNSAEIYSLPTGSWAPANDNMDYPRSLASAVLLPDGRVMVVGGDHVGGAPAEIYTYDNGVATWVHGLASIGRSGHTATLLSSGEVLITGGQIANTWTSSAGLMSSNGGWHEITPMQSIRARHTATLLPNGKVLVTGGQNGGYYYAEAELYDPVSETWSRAGRMNTGRISHTATLLPNGCVMIAGGQDIAGHYLQSVEIYNSYTNTWATNARQMNEPRGFHTATLLPDGRVLVAGGYYKEGANEGVYLKSAEIYDPAQNSWTPTASPMDEARERATATLLSDGTVLVTGGRNQVKISENNYQTNILRTIEIYDPLRDLWMHDKFSADLLNAGRYDHTVTLLSNGQVLVTGGIGTSSETSKSVEVFTPGADFQLAARPVINTIQAALVPDQPVVLTLSGAGLRGPGYAEASGGGSNSSATNVPLVQIRHLDSGRMAWLAPDPTVTITGDSYQSMPFSGFPSGPVLVSVFVNGTPSISKLIQLQWVKSPTVYLPTIRR